MILTWLRSPMHKCPLGSLPRLPPESEVFLGSWPHWSTSELLIATAFASYSLRFAGGGGPDRNTIPHLHLQAQARLLVSEHEVGSRSDDLVLWAKCMIFATSGIRLATSPWVEDGEEIRRLGDAFFPIPDSQVGAARAVTVRSEFLQ